MEPTSWCNNMILTWQASTRLTPQNTLVMRRDSRGRAFFSGTGGSEDGDRPFLDLRPLFDSEKVVVSEDEEASSTSGTDGFEYTSKTNAEGLRLWRCEEGCYESTTLIVEEENGQFVTLLTSRETQVRSNLRGDLPSYSTCYVEVLPLHSELSWLA